MQIEIRYNVRLFKLPSRDRGKNREGKGNFKKGRVKVCNVCREGK